MKTDVISQNKIFVWITLATILILLMPIIAMQFTSEVNWNFADFIVMGTLIFGLSSSFVLVAKKVQKKSQKIAIGVAFALGFLWLWAELAVGVFTNWGS